MKGKIIVIDGMDGTGKETQSKLLYNKIKESNDKVELFSFPNYENESSYFVRKYLHEGYCKDIDNTLLHCMFYSIDRCITYNEEIKRKYEEGYTIIFDRYYISNVIYNLHLLDTMNRKYNFCNYIAEIETKMLGLPIPNITIILASNPDVSSKLLDKRYDNDQNKRDIYENTNFQEVVLRNINQFYYIYEMCYYDKRYDINRYGKVKVLPIHDTENNIYSIDVMHNKIMNIVLKN